MIHEVLHTAQLGKESFVGQPLSAINAVGLCEDGLDREFLVVPPVKEVGNVLKPADQEVSTAAGSAEISPPRDQSSRLRRVKVRISPSL